MASEALSCATPTVAFNNTGFVDIVMHKKNGYLSNYLDENDFTNGIFWALENFDNSSIKKNCLEIFNQKFSNNKISNQYIDIYKSILSS